MSSASAGKFQDHYEVLGVDHKAASEVIASAYGKLSAKYNPRNGVTPDPEKFEAINLAYEVLSDPDLRSEFNKLKGIGADEKPRFSGLSFFDAYVRDNHLRVGLLCVLYDRRRTKPFTPSLSMRNLEGIFTATAEELNFALWYLKQREMVSSDDKSSLQITTTGMDYLQTHPPNPAAIMTLIRADADAGLDAEEESEAVMEAEPVPVTKLQPGSSSAVSRIGNVLARRNQN